MEDFDCPVMGKFAIWIKYIFAVKNLLCVTVTVVIPPMIQPQLSVDTTTESLESRSTSGWIKLKVHLV